MNVVHDRLIERRLGAQMRPCRRYTMQYALLKT